MNELMRQMAAHRTVREFTATPLPDEHLHEAIRAASMAATSSWVQAYHVLQVTDPSERARLAELCGDQPQVSRAGIFLVVSADTRRHRLIARREGSPYESGLETFLLGVIDASLFAQNLALACESMGYGVCYIGGLRARLKEVVELLEIPEGVWPLFGMAVGEPARVPGQRPWLPLEAILSRGRYLSDEAVLEGIAQHDREAARYYEERRATGRTWSGGVWRKFARRAREDLAEVYHALGARFE